MAFPGNRASLAGSDRTVSRPRSVARETAVRRTAPRADARALRRSLDRRQRRRRPCSMNRPATHGPTSRRGDVTSDRYDLATTHPPPRPRTDVLGTRVRGGTERTARAWQHTELPAYAPVARTCRVRLAAMDAFYKKTSGSSATRRQYHRIDIRQATRSRRPPAVTASSLTAPVPWSSTIRRSRALVRPACRHRRVAEASRGTDVLPVQGPGQLLRHRQNNRAAWSYVEAWPEVVRVSGFVIVRCPPWWSFLPRRQKLATRCLASVTDPRTPTRGPPRAMPRRRTRRTVCLPDVVASWPGPCTGRTSVLELASGRLVDVGTRDLPAGAKRIRRGPGTGAVSDDAVTAADDEVAVA